MTNIPNAGSRRRFLNRLTAMMAFAFLGLSKTDAQRNVANTQTGVQKKMPGTKSLKDYKISLKSDGLKAKNALNELIILIEKMPEDQMQVNNNQQEYQTLFDSFDQKTSQLMNILSTVLKSMREMQSSVVRNAL